MKYVITQDDLYELNKQLYYAEDNNKTPYEIINNFLKSKIPIEEIASGKMIIPWESEGFLIDGNFIGEIFHNKFGDNSKNIKIFIQEL